MNDKAKSGETEKPEKTWWGTFSIDVDRTIRWSLGGLDITITRQAGEWDVNYSYAGTESAQSSDELWNRVAEVDPDGERICEAQHHARIVCRKTADHLTLTPMMPNRSMVSRPWDVLQIPSGEETTLFVGAPIWIRFAFGTQKDHFIDIPVRRLSDTWFGPSPMNGELCYASRTRAFTDTSMLVRRPYRALLPVTIKNRAESELKLERINLPVPLLNVYRDKQGSFWSQGISLSREEDRKEVNIRIDRSAPDYAVDAELVSEAVEKSDPNLLTKTLDMLFA